MSGILDDLDPEAPGLDEDTRRRRRVLREMQNMSYEERLALAVKAGILTPEGELTESYRYSGPSPYRDALSGSALDFPILDAIQEHEPQGSVHYEQVMQILERHWVVGENEVLSRMRRMAAAGFLASGDLFHFSLTEKGREALRTR